MNIRTFAVTVSAPRDTVFHFLADIENLPKWAGGWCERLALEHGRWWALTAEGEQVVDMETSAGTGVIDLRTGPSPERMTPVPIRLFALSSRRTLVSFIVIEAPDRPAADCNLRHDRWLTAARGLIRRFSGGELHVAEPPAEFLALGLN
jgi:hypothetical protein